MSLLQWGGRSRVVERARTSTVGEHRWENLIFLGRAKFLLLFCRHNILAFDLSSHCLCEADKNIWCFED